MTRPAVAEARTKRQSIARTVTFFHHMLFVMPIEFPVQVDEGGRSPQCGCNEIADHNPLRPAKHFVKDMFHGAFAAAPAAVPPILAAVSATGSHIGFDTMPKPYRISAPPRMNSIIRTQVCGLERNFPAFSRSLTPVSRAWRALRGLGNGFFWLKLSATGVPPPGLPEICPCICDHALWMRDIGYICLGRSARNTVFAAACIVCPSTPADVNFSY